MKNKKQKIVSLILIITFSIITSLDAQMKYAQKVIESQMNAVCLVKGLKALKGFSLNQYLKVVEPQ